MNYPILCFGVVSPLLLAIPLMHPKAQHCRSCRPFIAGHLDYNGLYQRAGMAPYVSRYSAPIKAKALRRPPLSRLGCPLLTNNI